MQQIPMKLGGVKNTVYWEGQAVCPDGFLVVFCIMPLNLGLTESFSDVLIYTIKPLTYLITL